MGITGNIFNGLLALAGFEPDANGRPYERRVYLVTDAGKRTQILDMMAAHERNTLHLLAALMRATKDNNQKTRAEAQDEFSALAHKTPTNAETLDTLVGVVGWPGMLQNKEPHGCWTGVNAAEAVLHKGQVYITMPTAEDIEAAYDEPEALAIIRSWTPPEGLQEVPPGTLGRRPVGFPRAIHSLETIEKYQSRSLQPQP
jgi:hypothetical protein